MGNTTILELNHDLFHEIADDPEGFVRQIQAQLRSFEYRGKRIRGGVVIAAWNRGDNLIDRDWQTFKERHRDKKEG